MKKKYIPLCKALIVLSFTVIWFSLSHAQRPRELGIKIGVLTPGPLNSITDVKGVKVGHYTLNEGEDIHTGITAILPHPGNIFQQKVPAAIHVGNGFGKLAGSTQVIELGNIETPILLTNTLNVGRMIEAVVEYTLQLPGNEEVGSVNAVVGETNDGYLNDIRGMHLTKEHAVTAIRSAKEGPVKEGNVGAGTGTVCFGFKGGIGTSSRKLPGDLGGYTVGVLVQTNFGGVLTIDGVPVGEELGQYYLSKQLEQKADGSCMIVIATDAPLEARNLQRLAKRAMLGLGRTGGIASNGSGDYVIAFSTAEHLFEEYSSDRVTTGGEVLRNDNISPLFMAVIEATEEAIINSLFAAETMTGREGHTIQQLPVKETLKIIRRYNKLSK
ncbi:MAG: P1 family peptidase [Cyclobacteriaceae bacterium]|nr:P1 family peptidase [Cyclobacteriaceae bacterium]